MFPLCRGASVLGSHTETSIEWVQATNAFKYLLITLVFYLSSKNYSHTLREQQLNPSPAPGTAIWVGFKRWHGVAKWGRYVISISVNSRIMQGKSLKFHIWQCKNACYVTTCPLCHYMFTMSLHGHYATTCSLCHYIVTVTAACIMSWAYIMPCEKLSCWHGSHSAWSIIGRQIGPVRSLFQFEPMTSPVQLSCEVLKRDPDDDEGVCGVSL
jgi:hypothetical protein